MVVIGGGIAGLSAALRIRDTAPGDVRITVIEQGQTLGGKLRTQQLDGARVEAGAESFLVRRPEGLALAERVGLSDALIHPATRSATVLVDGVLRPLPTGTLMGLPGSADSLAGTGVVDQATLDAVRAEPDVPGDPVTEDIAVGALVGARLGRQIVDRLVEPLLGGVYAGRADELSLRATVPALVEPLAAHPSLVRAVRQVTSKPTPGPVFASVSGGLSRLVEATATTSGATVRYGLPARELRQTDQGWQIVVGSTRDPEIIVADAVVVAVPAAPAARLLSTVESTAAAEIAALDYASIALITFVLPTTALPEGSGALVPASSGMLVKAMTYVSQKWPSGGDTTVIRASVGRYGDERMLHHDDDELTALVRSELEGLLGPLPAPRDTAVNRWGGALPQYGVGHLDRVRRARAALDRHPGLALAGAAYDGVGIPLCIRSGTAAADRVIGALRGGAESIHV